MLQRRGASVEAAVPFSELRTAIGDHVAILIRALVTMAIILAIVGLLGLASAVGVSVLERSREIAVMKTLGATARVVRRLIVTEAMVSSGVSWVVALLLSIPLTFGIEVLIGQLGFLAALPFVLSVPSMVLWAALLAGATLVATLAPVRRATSMTVREALTGRPDRRPHDAQRTGDSASLRLPHHRRHRRLRCVVHTANPRPSRSAGERDLEGALGRSSRDIEGQREAETGRSRRWTAGSHGLGGDEHVGAPVRVHRQD